MGEEIPLLYLRQSGYVVGKAQLDKMIARASHQAEATGKPFSLQQTFAAIWASGTLTPIFCPRICHTWIKTPDGWQIIGGMSCPALDRKS